MPSMCGVIGDDRQPVAMMQNLAATGLPSLVPTIHNPDNSSRTMSSTRVLRWMSPRRLNRSAT